MSATQAPGPRERTARFSRASAIWSVIAAVLFFGSAALQFVASLERWVVFRLSSKPLVAEDHLYDYVFPYDPWENIGTSAQLFGVGTLILALGVLAMAISVIVLPSTESRRGVAVLFGVAEILVAAVVSGLFGIFGAHALISGVTGTPSPLNPYWAMGWVAVVGLTALIVPWKSKSPAAMLACVFLMGSTGLGHYVAAFFVAPIFAGYVSYDTTPWTETVIAVWTAAAGFSMVIAARDAIRRRATDAAT